MGQCKTTHKEFLTSRREMRTVAIVGVAHVAVGRGSKPPCGQRTPRKTKGRGPPRAAVVATNPKTGAAYPGGPIVNGRLNFDNASSWSGWTQSERLTNDTYTANVETVNELRPAPGVYAVKVQHGSNRFGGAANIGVKPTFGGTEVSIEVHLFDFSGDLYGQRLRVEFVERLRSEKRFASVTELAGQIARDIESARAALQRAG